MNFLVETFGFESCGWPTAIFSLDLSGSSYFQAEVEASLNYQFHALEVLQQDLDAGRSRSMAEGILGEFRHAFIFLDMFS